MAINWGVLGASQIGAAFAASLASVDGAQLAAVASRDARRAAAFAQTYNAQHHYADYQSLIDDPTIDVVYIAVAPSDHASLAMAALRAGKAVLCEKPFTVNVDDARRIADLAADKNLFCMEAMWMRFHPLVQDAKKKIMSGEIGDIRYFRAEAGYATAPEKYGSTDAGRGALLNFGVYGVSLAHYLLGPPDAVSGALSRIDGAVDGGAFIHLAYDGFSACIAAAVDATLSNEASIVGRAGRMTLDAPFFAPPSMISIPTPAPIAPRPSDPSSPPIINRSRMATILGNVPYAAAITRSRLIQTIRGRAAVQAAPAGVDGLGLEAAEVVRCLEAGATSSTVMPMADTINVLETLDAVRTQMERG